MKCNLFPYIILSSLSGHPREAVKEVDTSYNGTERGPIGQRLPKSDSYQPKPVGPTSDYCHHSEQPAAQHPEMASSPRESVMNTPPKSASSQLSASTSPAAVSASLTKDTTPPRVSAAPAISESPTSAPGPPIVPSPDTESTPPQISTSPNVSSASSSTTPPRLSSTPLMKGLRPEMPSARSKHLSVGSSSSSLPSSPLKSSTPLASTDSSSRPAAVSSPSDSAAHQNKSSLPPTASGPPTTVSPPLLVSVSSYSASLQQMVQGSKPPLTTSATQHEKPGTPNLLSATSSVGTKSSSAGVAPTLKSVSGPSTSTSTGSCLSTSASTMSVSKTPSVGSKPCDPAPTNQCQTYTPPAADSRLSTASAASLPPVAVNLPSLAAHESPTVRPLSTLPLLTTQASWTAPVSTPPALVSVPPAVGTSSGVVQSSDTEQNPPNSTSPRALKPSSPKPEHHGHTEDSKTLANKRNGKPEEHFAQLDSDTRRTSQTVKGTEIDKSSIRLPKSFNDRPDKPLQTAFAFTQNPNKKQTDSEKHHMQSSVICGSEESTVDQTPVRKPSHLHRAENLTDEQSFNSSSQFDEFSTFTTPSRIDVSSVLEKSSLVDDDSFDNSFHLRKDAPRVDCTSHTEEEASTAFDTTRDSISSVEGSRDDTLDSTREEEISEAEETKDSCQITGDSMLESSLNNTSQMEEPPVHSSDVSKSRSFVPSQPSGTGTILKLMIMETIITWVTSSSY